jgi:hypothetical protein
MATKRVWHAADSWGTKAAVLLLTFCLGGVVNGTLKGVGLLPWLWNNTHKLEQISPHNEKVERDTAGNQMPCVMKPGYRGEPVEHALPH